FIMPFITRYEVLTKGSFTGAANGYGLGSGEQNVLTSLDTANQVAGWPPGTTTNYLNSSCSIVVPSLPPGSTILYADLVCCLAVTAISNNSYKLEAPDGTQYTIVPEVSIDDSWEGIRINDIKDIINSKGTGTYKLFGLPTQINAGDGMFSIFIIYENLSMPLRKFNVNLGSTATGSSVNQTFKGFLVPPTGVPQGRMIVNLMDADGSGSFFVNGGNGSKALSGPNNPQNAFWNSQINIIDSESPNVGMLDTTGSFGSFNRPAPAPNTSWQRYGVDITNISLSQTLTNNSNTVTVNTAVPDAIAMNVLITQIDSVGPFIQTTKAVDLAAAKKGDVLVYTIGVSNTGTNMANTVRLLDTLPTGLSFKSGSVMLDGVSYPSATVLPPLGFLIGDMPIDSYHTVTFNVDVIAKATAFTNTGTIAYKYSTTPSTIPDYLAFKDTNDVVTTFIDSPNFTITKIVDRNFAISTDTISYTLVIKNTGTLASDAILFDTLPSGLTFIPNSIKVNNLPISGDIIPPGITLTSIAINEVRTVTFNASINSSTTVFTNTGYIYSTIPDLTNVESNIVTTTLVNPSVSSIKFVDKTFATLNDTITYTIAINNTGNVDFKNVFFLDTINLGATFIPNSVQVNSIPVSSVSVVPPGFLALASLPAGTTSTISFLAKV
ncbi:MAG: hypothetical protein ACRC28_11620, partial [Clostridium sp.]